ncbi:hypothetical protein Tco_0015684 [Tanacetum coccineum]
MILVGYSTYRKAFRVFNSRTRIVEENLHVQFSENTPNIVGSGPNWLFDIDALTNSMNYKPVVAENQSNSNAVQRILLMLDSNHQGRRKRRMLKIQNESGNPSEEGERINQEKDASVNSTNNINTVSPTVNSASIEDNFVDENIVYGCADDPNIPDLEEIGRFSDAENDDSWADINNLDTYFQVSPVPTTRIHKDHPLNQVIGDLQSATQTRQMTKNLEEYGFVSTTLKQRTSHKDLQNCLFACFLSQEEPKKIEDEGLCLSTPRYISMGARELRTGYKSGIRHIREDGRINEWRTSGKRTIIKLMEVEKNEMSDDVACLDIAPVPKGRPVGEEDGADHPASLFLNVGLQNRVLFCSGYGYWLALGCTTSCAEGVVVVGDALRVFTLERFGETFNETTIPLSAAGTKVTTVGVKVTTA